MGVGVSVRYDGERACTAVHGPSGAQVRTVPPTDNGGDGSSFSPTDLVAAGLGTCVLTILAMRAEQHGLDLTGATVELEKRMSSEPPRRIAQIPLVLKLPAEPDAATREELETAARECPVSLTLGDNVEVDVRFEWAAQPQTT